MNRKIIFSLFVVAVFVLSCSNQPSDNLPGKSPTSVSTTSEKTSTAYLTPSSAKLGMKTGRSATIEPFNFINNNYCLQQFRGLGDEFVRYCSIVNCLEEIREVDGKFCDVKGSGVSAPALEVVFDLPTTIPKDKINSLKVEAKIACKYSIFIGYLSKYGEYSTVAKPGSASAEFYACSQPNINEEVIEFSPDIVNNQIVVAISGSSQSGFSDFALAKVDSVKVLVTYINS